MSLKFEKEINTNELSEEQLEAVSGGGIGECGWVFPNRILVCDNEGGTHVDYPVFYYEAGNQESYNKAIEDAKAYCREQGWSDEWSFRY